MAEAALHYVPTQTILAAITAAGVADSGNTSSTSQSSASPSASTTPNKVNSLNAVNTPERLQPLIAQLERWVPRGLPEPALLEKLRPHLAALIERDDWLPTAYAKPNAERYRQYPLHVDPEGRFSIVSFVWGPGQATPIHDHLVWGLIGMLRGAEYSQGYRFGGPDSLVPDGPPVRLSPGQVEAVSPRLGDIHRVRNAFDDEVSISIHVYGTDIGRIERHTYDENGHITHFVSGYSPLE